jgi:hypothetical protein
MLMPTQDIVFVALSCSVDTHPPEPALDRIPPRWEVPIRVLMSQMSHMMLLPDIDCPLVILAVVGVVTQGLHLELGTLLHHGVGE